MNHHPFKSLYASARLLGLVSAAIVPTSAFAGYGLTTTTAHYTVDTGAGLVFKVDRLNGGMPSIVLDGTELNVATPSGLISGLSSGGTTVTATADSNTIKVIVATDGTNAVLPGATHYYIVQSGVNNIYMATHTTAHPGIGELRWITRLESDNFTNFQVGSDLRGGPVTIESGDVFGYPDGTTGSKYYGNQRAKDLSIRGITGPGRGVFMVYGNRETSSCGPFFQDIQFQTSEVYNYMNSGHNRTESPYRLGLHGPYALCFTSGSTPAIPNMSFMATQGITDYVGPSGRGIVTCAGISNWDTSYAYTAGFANTTAQYWADVSAVDGSFTMSGMKPGTYTMKIYKNELAVYTSTTVTVTESGTTTLNPITITGDPSTNVPIWRIGNWDGTPLEFLNAPKIRFMHPSDVRMSSWAPSTYLVGANSVDSFPSIQWKAINGNQFVEFNLSAGQIGARTVRIGITGSFAGGRPTIMVNTWASALPAASNQPTSRNVTLGSYRGNNTTYTYSVPSSAFVVGTNTLKISAISGSSGTDYLSPNYSIDCLDIFDATAPTLAIASAPSALTAMGGNAEVSLSWTASTGAASYSVQSAATPGGPYVTIASGVSGTTYTDTGLINGSTYYYVVKAVNTSGTGMPSAEASATTEGEVTTPSAPTNPAATALSASQIDLSWTASAGATSYNVKRATTSGGPYTTVGPEHTGTSYSDTGLSASTTYYYVVSAVNVAGESSGSAEATATTLVTIPSAPINPAATAVSASQIDLSWTASSGAASYNVKRATTSGGPYTTVAPMTTSTSHSDNGLSASTPYYYVISAVNAAGESADSTEVSATPASTGQLQQDSGSDGIVSMEAENYDVNVAPGNSLWTFGVRSEHSGSGIMEATPNLGSNYGTGYVTSSPRLDFQVNFTKTGTHYVWIRGIGTSGADDSCHVGLNGLANPAGDNMGNWTPSWSWKQSTTDGPVATINVASTGIHTVNIWMREDGFILDKVVLTVSGSYIPSGNGPAESLRGSGVTAPSAPTSPAATAVSASQIDLSWTAGSGAESYNVKRATTSGGPYMTVTSGVTSTGYSNTGLTASTTYYYVVSAVNSAGESADSAQASATTDAATDPAPSFVAAGSVASGTGSIQPGLPSGIASGDVLLLFVETAAQNVSISNQNGGTWAAVTGALQSTGSAGGSGSTQITVFWSRYNGSQGAPTVSDSGNHQIARTIAIRGAASSGEPWNVIVGGVESTSDTSGSIPGATTTVSDTLVVVAVAASLPDTNSTSKFSGWTNASLTNLTERTDNSRSVGNGGGLGIATGEMADAGSYGETAVSHANSATKAMVSIAIKN